MDNQFDYSIVQSILDKYPKEEASTIAVLQDIQEYYHYLPREIFIYISQALGVGVARLYGVATFYENFSLEAKGKYVIRCCDGTACHVRGSQPILNKIRGLLGLSEEKKTTDDNLFTVETVSCLGACGLAPVLTVNGETYPAMTPDKAVELIEQIKKQEAEGGKENE